MTFWICLILAIVVAVVFSIVAMSDNRDDLP